MRKHSFITNLILVLLIGLLSGCATVRKGSLQMTQKSKSFEVPEGQANIYVIRPYNYVGSVVVWSVTIDFRQFGTLGLRNYLFGSVPPGEHFLSASATMGSGHEDRIQFTTEAGKNYFFKVTPGFSGIGVKPIDEEAGRKYVNKFKLSGDNIFEYKDVLKENSLGF
jgi:hypothetical protein